MTEKEFDTQYVQAIDRVLMEMAQCEEVDPDKFFNLACVLENLRFFSPVLYGAILKAKKK